MADLKAQLEISADASGVEAGVTKAKRSLKDLGTTATTAGKQAADGLSEMGKGGDQASRKIDVATRSMSNSIQRQIALMEAGARGSREYYEALARQRGIDTNAIKPLLDQLDSISAKQGNVEMSSRQMAFAMRQVPAQFTDIVTSLQAGQAPMTVLIQQGGQLKDSLGGVGPAAKALGGYVMGLISPLALAAGAVAALGYAYHQGSKEADAYRKALILTGNAAATTAAELDGMARRISESTGTQGAAAAALAELAGTGRIGAENLEAFARTALAIEKTVGQSVADTARDLADLAKAPLDASEKLNEKYRYLTASIYEQIKALEDQGRTEEAAAVAQRAYTDAFDERTKEIQENLGYIERAWAAVSGEAKKAWDSMLDIGRKETINDLSNQLNFAIASGATEYEIKNIEDRLNKLRDVEAQEKKIAKEKADAARLDQLKIDWVKEGEKYLSREQQLRKELNRTEQESQKLLEKGLITQEQYTARIAAVKAKFEDKGAAKSLIQIDKAQLTSDLSAIKQASEELLGTYANAEKVMEAMRSAGLINDRDYYESKRAFINLEAQAKEEALKKEIDRLQQEKLSGKERIENDRKIAEAQAEIAKLREQSATELETLTIKETQSANRLKTAYEEAEAAARSYLDTLRLQQQRELDGMGLGNRNRDRNRGRAQIEDRYNQQLLQLESDKRRGAFDGREEDYQAELDRIRRFQGEALSSYNSYYDELIEKQGSWSLGASEALNNYLDDAQNVFKQTEDLVGNSFSGMEDAIVQFAMNGKASFGDFARSVVSGLIRIQAQQALSGLAMNLGSLIGLGSSGTPLSTGGFSAPSFSAAGGFDVPSGVDPVTQLHEREMVLPQQYADVIRGLAQGGKNGGGININIINNASAKVSTRPSADGGGIDVLIDAIDDALGDRIGAGVGSTSAAMQGRYGLRPAVGV